MFFPPFQCQPPTSTSMAYQSRQPCLPPPLNVAQHPTEPGDRCAAPCVHRPLWEEPCSGQPAVSIPHQSTQPCLPPPSCLQPCLVETPNACAPAWTSFCNTASVESCPAPSVETSSVACDPPTLSSCRPLPANVEPCTAESTETYAPPCVTLCTSPDGSTMAPREAAMSYVLPGSIVSLDPYGSVTVKPGPSEDGETGNTTDSIFVGSYAPHYL